MPSGHSEIPDPSAACWQLFDASALRWAQWEAETSLFNADTGETHLLSEFPAFLLATLSEGPLTLNALSELTAQACDANNDAAWQTKVRGVLEELAGLELVQQQHA